MASASKLHDADILFNPSPWAELVETQRDLFNPDALIRISDRLRGEFHDGHADGRDMPEIAPQDWNTKLLAPYVGGTIGYDLPCLLSADRPSRGRIMLCAQDPLRKPGGARLTVGTFFGIDNHTLRTRRHYGVIWLFIRQCVLAGYDVWVTDAIKLYAGRNVLRRDPDLRSLSISVISAEVAAFRPDKILTFGNDARWAMKASGAVVPLTHVAHPNARGIKGPFKDRLIIYSQALFGSDSPQ